MKAKALIDECASGGLQVVKPVVGVAFGVGDCENPDFGRKIKKHQCIGKSRKYSPTDLEITGRTGKPGERQGTRLYRVPC